MKKLLVINFEGINYYTFAGCKTVNMTYDTVNEQNCEDISDFNCFTTTDYISNTEELKVDVMDYIANNKLEDIIYQDLLKVANKKKALLAISRLNSQRCIRENFVLADYDYLVIEDNVLIIYSKKDDCYGVTLNFGDDDRYIGNIIG